MKNPIQPLVKDSSGVLRFKENKIVQYVFDCGFSGDMNALARMDFTDDDRQQFAQLLGYSLSGYGAMRYVSKEAYRDAAHMVEGLDERDSRIAALEQQLKEMRDVVEKARELLNATWFR